MIAARLFPLRGRATDSLDRFRPDSPRPVRSFLPNAARDRASVRNASRDARAGNLQVNGASRLPNTGMYLCGRPQVTLRTGCGPVRFSESTAIEREVNSGKSPSSIDLVVIELFGNRPIHSRTRSCETANPSEFVLVGTSAIYAAVRNLSSKICIELFTAISILNAYDGEEQSGGAVRQDGRTSYCG